MAESVDMVPDTIKGYRADPTGKHGGKSGLETLPLQLSKNLLLDITGGLQRAKELGMPAIGADPEFLVNKILVEGREDAGTNEFNENNRQAMELYKILRSEGVKGKSAVYAAAVLDKTQQAERLNKDFEELWNGVRTAESMGRTGKQHSQRSKAHKYAATAQENKELLNFIGRAISGDLSPQENLLKMEDDEVLRAVIGLPPNERLYAAGSGSSTFYSDLAVKAAREKLQYALGVMSSTRSGRDKAVSLHASENRDDDLRPIDLLNNLSTEYLRAAGISTAQDTTPLARNESSKHIVDILTGIDPGGQKYLESAAKEFPQPPSLLDRLQQFFTSTK